MEASVIRPSYSPRFLDRYTGRISSDPKTAIMEIVANAWDAGATKVDITWPLESIGGTISIQDNGSGMTDEEFVAR